jgi:hypothetical protein
MRSFLPIISEIISLPSVKHVKVPRTYQSEPFTEMALGFCDLFIPAIKLTTFKNAKFGW